MTLTDPHVITQQLVSIRWRSARGKHFGQHFLTDARVLERIVTALELEPHDTVVEIGPGLGALTVELAKRAARVVAVEKDGALVPVLQKNLVGISNVEIVNADALVFDPTSYKLTANSYVLAGNLPYSITIPVIERFILDCEREAKRLNTEAKLRDGSEAKLPSRTEAKLRDGSEAKLPTGSLASGSTCFASVPSPSRAVFLIQKEVAERLTAFPGNSARGAMTVVLEAGAKSEIIAPVPRKDFFPVPEVDGAIIRIVPRGHEPWTMDHGSFRDFVFSVFRQRRKQIAHTLRSVCKTLDASEIATRLLNIGVDSRARAQELTLDQWCSVFRVFML